VGKGLEIFKIHKIWYAMFNFGSMDKEMEQRMIESLLFIKVVIKDYLPSHCNYEFTNPTKNFAKWFLIGD